MLRIFPYISFLNSRELQHIKMVKTHGNIKLPKAALQNPRRLKECSKKQFTAEIGIRAHVKMLSNLLAHIALTRDTVDNNMQSEESTKLKGVRKLAF